MEKKKTILVLLTTAIIAIATITPILFVKTVAAADPTDWYMGANGVLATDTYALYPYEQKNIKLGFSQFGELINSNTNVGLEYAGARDPFAPVAGSTIVSALPKKVWINGWYIDIRYVHQDWGKRCVWAGALFADKTDYGKNWIRVDNDYTYPPYQPQYEYQETFDDKGKELNGFTPIEGLVNGGRKTNGTAITDPIQVLYDGPRLFVATSVTHIYDWNEDLDENLHLVDVVLTIMFNKVKKEVIVLKDVKFIEQAKFILADLTINVGGDEVIIPDGLLVQFSNREEWDLGTTGVSGTVDYSSYAHFYTAGTAGSIDTVSEGQSTAYDDAWTGLPTLPRGVVYDGVTVNAHGSEPGSSGTYDVAQIISNDAAYVGWHAFWPSLSDWSIDAARGTTTTWYRAIAADDPHYVDSYSYEPFRSPLVVGEWDFVLSSSSGSNETSGVYYYNQFRGVSVYGVTDLNNGDDAGMGAGHTNVLDTEVLYQLDEIFNPWDLNDAVHKDTTRWVEYHYGSTSWTSSYKPVIDVSDEEWDDYCTFSERVEDLTAGTVLTRDDYTFYVDEDGYAHITGLISTHHYKILYSTDTVYGYNGTINFEIASWTNVAPEDSYILEDEPLDNGYEFEDWLGATHTIRFEDGSLTIQNTSELTDGEWTGTFSFNPFVYDVKVFKEDIAHLGTWNLDFGPEEFDGTLSITLSSVDLSWRVEGPDNLDLHIDYADAWITFAVTVTYDSETETCNVTLEITLEPYPGNDYLYLEHIPGRYEWTVVGRDAASVDSVGAALVTAAFKNKQVEIGLAGADMYDPLPYNQMPYVISKIGVGNARADYYYGGTDYRTALRDDWCYAGTVSGDEWPISSSNMIGVGGPLANLLAYYGNDFAQAIFGLNEFTDYSYWEEAIIPLTCWNIAKTQAYSSSNETGYAVISTYKDINGTVIFLVWGHWGRDTFYASKWFHEEGVFQLQEAPDGLTSIILKIDYESTDEGYKPTDYSIVECLGTISETLWIHNGEYKGGIHDP